MDSSNFILESGLPYFWVLPTCVLLVYFVSAAGCHCFDSQFQTGLHGRHNRIFTWISHLDLSILYLTATCSCAGCHAWGKGCLLNPEHLVVLLAGPISHTSIQHMDFVKIFNSRPDLSTIYFSCFSGRWVSFVSSCYSTQECCTLFCFITARCNKMAKTATSLQLRGKTIMKMKERTPQVTPVSSYSLIGVIGGIHGLSLNVLLKASH